MRDLLPQLKTWLSSNQPFSLATVVSTWGSGPRKSGAYMAIREDNTILGSVSGGCVEGAVIEEAKKVIQTGKTKRLHFGVPDENAWNVGLACGGEIDVFLQPADPKVLGAIINELEAEEYAAHVFSLAPEAVPQQVALLTNGNVVESDFEELLAEKPHKPRIFDHEGKQFFLNPLPPSPELVIIGGVHVAQALAELAKLMHFQPIIVDPRRAFLNTERFPETERIIQAWPDKAYAEIGLSSSSAVASLSHDPKIDDPALLGALKSEAFYIGALGSRKTHEKRLKRLQEAGASSEDLVRIQSPIGVDIGADNPEEIALAIMAQVIQAYRAN